MADNHRFDIYFNGDIKDYYEQVYLQNNDSKWSIEIDCHSSNDDEIITLPIELDIQTKEQFQILTENMRHYFELYKDKKLKSYIPIISGDLNSMLQCKRPKFYFSLVGEYEYKTNLKPVMDLAGLTLHGLIKEAVNEKITKVKLLENTKTPSIVEWFNKNNSKYMLTKLNVDERILVSTQYLLKDKDGNIPPELDIGSYGYKSFDVFRKIEKEFTECFGKPQEPRPEYDTPYGIGWSYTWKFDNYVLQLNAIPEHPRTGGQRLAIIIHGKMLSILKNLKAQGETRLFKGVLPNKIQEWELKNRTKLPEKYKEFLLFHDGAEYFLPAGMQLYGIEHEPVIDIADNDRLNSAYIVIGRLASGDTIIFEREQEKISIFNCERNCIEDDETYDNFEEFLIDLPEILGIDSSNTTDKKILCNNDISTIYLMDKQLYLKTKILGKELKYEVSGHPYEPLIYMDCITNKDKSFRIHSAQLYFPTNINNVQEWLNFMQYINGEILLDTIKPNFVSMDRKNFLLSNIEILTEGKTVDVTINNMPCRYYTNNKGEQILESNTKWLNLSPLGIEKESLRWLDESSYGVLIKEPSTEELQELFYELLHRTDSTIIKPKMIIAKGSTTQFGFSRDQIMYIVYQEDNGIYITGNECEWPTENNNIIVPLIYTRKLAETIDEFHKLSIEQIEDEAYGAYMDGSHF